MLTPRTAVATPQLVGTLPLTLPTPADGASSELISYHAQMAEWYSNFLFAYNSQLQQIVSKLPTT